MTADRKLKYGGFREGVVNGQVNDGNAYRRGNGVSLNAGLFGTAEAAAALGRAWLARDGRLLPERFFALATENATAGPRRGSRPRLAARVDGGERGGAARPGGVRAHGLHGRVALRRPRARARRGAAHEPAAPGRADRRDERLPPPLPRDRGRARVMCGVRREPKRRREDFFEGEEGRGAGAIRARGGAGWVRFEESGSWARG